MKIMLSPAKTLDMESSLPVDKSTQPLFTKDIETIRKVMKKMSAPQLGTLMHISDNLAQLNHQRFQEFETTFSEENARPAIYTFAGDVYTGLDAYTLDTKHIPYLQDNVRILSGLYGYLRPLDLMQPYRLEMGTSIAIAKADNLYAFWKKKITESLNKEIQDGELVVNLASNEYFKAVDTKSLRGQLISPVFKDFKNDKLKVISFFAKKARGTMTRYLVENKANTLEDILSFKEDGYAYSAQHTAKASEPVFIR
jgi:cytoplasmic iron level regulating protein YaaA (DUF328/UPF0246 family)